MDVENRARTINEMAFCPTPEGTTRLFGQTRELDHKGDILLSVNCPLSMTNNVKCTHQRENGKAGEDPIAADLSIT